MKRFTLKFRILLGVAVLMVIPMIFGAMRILADSETDSATDSAAQERPGARSPTVVLISLDGTRSADVTASVLPSLVEVAKQGAQASGLVPVDPSNTFPSHVSLATGVRPEVHRLVNNLFIDPERGRFTRDAPHTWIESEPIWSVVERHGFAAASFHWVGSEGPWTGGPGPRDTRKFSSRTLEKTKVNQILKWLDMKDESERPRLITSWFHGADHAAHMSGPGTASVAASLAPQDDQIARLVREMEKRDLFGSTTLVFVSDHGMLEAEERVNLGRLFDRAGVDVSLLGVGGFAIGVFDEAERSPSRIARAVEVAREAGLEAWSRREAPADWHVSDPRFGDFVVRAPTGVAIVKSTTMIDGFHGYDAREPAMAGLLVARGRGIRSGTRLGSVSSLSIAPTILRLLALPVPPQMASPPIREFLNGIDTAQAPKGASKN